MELTKVTSEIELNKILSEESGSRVVIVDFYADWCSPCKALSPVLDEISTEESSSVKIIKVNVDDALELAQKYQIRGIPTLIFVKNNELKDKLTGNASKQDLVAKIKSLT